MSEKANALTRRPTLLPKWTLPENISLLPESETLLRKRATISGHGDCLGNIIAREGHLLPDKVILLPD